MKRHDHTVLINVNGIPQQTVIAGIAARMFHDQKFVTPIGVLSPSTKRHADVRSVFESFGIQRFLRISRNPITHPWALIKSLWLTARAWMMIRSQGFEAFIEHFTVSGVHLGDLIYDSLIRYQHSYRDPLGDGRKLFRTLFNSLWLACVCETIIRRERVKYVVMSESVYAITEALFMRFAAHRGLKVLFVNASFARFYTHYEDTFWDRFKVTPVLMEGARKHANRMEVVEAYLEKRFSGRLAHHDVINAYRDKRVWTRDDLASHFKLGERAGKKNIFVMPHCFSDANHKTRHVLFRDFYQWFNELLTHIRNIRDVNWFIKPHPSGHHYREENQVEDLVRAVQCDHIFLIPPDFSTTSVLRTADAILTVNGTIGLEAACCGIRPILAGEAVYSGFGFTTLPTSREEYFKVVDKIVEVQKLSPEEVRMAKEVLFCFQFYTRPFSSIIPSGSVRPGISAADFEKVYADYYQTMAENMEKVDIRDDAYLSSLSRLIESEESSIQQQGPIAVT